nr:hypothetical protein [uncultured Steroidobacter sp.]
MLSSTKGEQTLAAAVRLYLRDALGADAQILPWSDARKLPYFLRDAFYLNTLRLFDREFLLASPRQGQIPGLSALRTQLDKVAQVAGCPVVFTASALASYERKRLVEQKVPFVIPGNQLYLPDLGIDFREYFRQAPAAVTALTPATQAVFIAALLRKEWQVQWQPAEVTTALGYTAMTLSRAVRELTAAGLVGGHQEGRTRIVEMKYPPAEAWEHAKPLLRSPVKRSVWLEEDLRGRVSESPLAGLSALAFYSMLAEPPRPIYAVGVAQWKAVQRAGVTTLPESRSDASLWQVWSYAPNLLPGSEAVDPLSLTLSLQDEQDERVQQALQELRGRFPW